MIDLSARPLLSLILPAYRSAGFIEASVTTVLETLEQLGEPFEIIVVCDGNADDAPQRVRALDDPRVHVVAYDENRGKGFAVCVGVSRALGRVVGWLDADLDVSPSFVVAATRRLLDEDLDAVVGSKRHPQSQVDYPLVRRFLSVGFQVLVRLALRVNVSDTQTGAKVFRREVLDTVVPLLLIKRYAFDLEVLAVAAVFGFDRLEEAPIRLDYRFSGTGINSEAVKRMFIDVLAITYRVRLRHWYVRQFAALQRRRLDSDADGVLGGPSVPASNLATIQVLLRDDPLPDRRN